MDYKYLENKYMHNIKTLLYNFPNRYKFYRVNNLDFFQYNAEELDFELFKSRNSFIKRYKLYEDLGKDIENNGMYAPLYVDNVVENKVIEGAHRLMGLKSINSRLNVLCMSLSEDSTVYTTTYKLEDGKLKKVNGITYIRIVENTIDIDMEMNKIRSEKYYPSSKFFTNEEIFKREMAEYERTKISRN